MTILPDNTATWLELAVAPASRLNNANVRLHPVSGSSEDAWFALSVNGKLLLATSGKLTLLKGTAAVERFLFLIGLRSSEPGEPICLNEDRDQGAFGMQIERNPLLQGFGELRLSECVEVTLANQPY